MTDDHPSTGVDALEQREIRAVLDKILAAGAPEAAGQADDEFDSAGWRQLSDAGFTGLTCPAELGGAGASWYLAALVLKSAGAHAARVPYAQHDLIAGRLLDTAGLARAADGVRVAAVFDRDSRQSTATWARHATEIVALYDAGTPAQPAWRVARLPAASVEIRAGSNLAGEPHDTVVLNGPLPQGVPVGVQVPEQLRLQAALASVLQMAGAAERALELTVEHAGVRHQFGRALAKFQAVQHLIADSAAEVSLIQALADAAVRVVGEFGWDHPKATFAVSAAVSGAGHAAAPLVRNAHQVLGAIGYTREHPLHHYTNRLLAWRSAHGPLQRWDAAVARDAAAAAAADGLWAWLVGGQQPDEAFRRSNQGGNGVR